MTTMPIRSMPCSVRVAATPCLGALTVSSAHAWHAQCTHGAHGTIHAAIAALGLHRPPFSHTHVLALQHLRISLPIDRKSRTPTLMQVAQQRRGRGARCCASRDDRSKVDWDQEWSSFVSDRQTSSGADGAGRRGARPRTTTRAVPVDPAARMTRNAIKREESLLLNAWSSGAFQGAGVAAAVLVLLVVLLGAGPPPADSRCTLPWC